MLNVLMDRADLTPYAPLVQADCLLVHNADDPMFSPTAAADLARLLPRQRLLIWSGERWSAEQKAGREIERFLMGDSQETRTGSFRTGVPGVLGARGSQSLTPRQAEILRHVVAGATNEEIATVLSLSNATIARHLANVYLKLGVRNRVEATNWAHQHASDSEL